MSPFRIVENNEIKRDLITFLQNSVRDPKLQLEDIKVKLHACLRIKERIRHVIEECGVEAVIATLRRSLEDVDAEVKRRIATLPDGTVRIPTFIDGTLRENVLMKINFAITVKGERMIIDCRGSSPEFTNRSLNSILASFKTSLLANFLTFIWPDLPHNMAVFSSIEVVAHENSLVHCSVEAPNTMCLIPIMRALSMPSLLLAKMYYSLPHRWTNVIAVSYTQPATFIYGGQTQHGEITGNFCADINGMGQGARAVRDGEHALAPVFGFFCDTGEQELIEEELPMVRLIAQHITTDRVGFGKYRGGAGYEQVVTVKDTPGWGLMTGCTGSRHPSTLGLFGGYSCPAYPLVKIKNVNIFEVLKNNPDDFAFDIVTLMNEQALDGDYGSYDMGLTLEPVKEGEVYGICQGAGGGYGDVLDREPELVMKDLAEDVISHVTAREIYFVVYNENNLVVDEDATRAARDAERQARIRRGKPFKEFFDEWTTPEPPENLPYYGSWDDDEVIWAGIGETRVKMNGNEMRGTILPHQKDVLIEKLKQEVAELKARLGDT
jgi:N-methylhydantoinase B/oxoprolinase/acetone carboxylase alpha subunit